MNELRPQNTGFDNFSRALASGELAPGRILGRAKSALSNLIPSHLTPDHNPARRRLLGVGLTGLGLALLDRSPIGKTLSDFSAAPVSAQEVTGNPTPSSEDPYVTEILPNGQPHIYNVIAQRSEDPVGTANDEITRMINDGLIKAGVCIQVREMISVSSLESAAQTGDPNRKVYRHVIDQVPMSACTEPEPPIVPICKDTEFKSGPWQLNNLNDRAVLHGDLDIITSAGQFRTYDTGTGSENTGSITDIIPNGQPYSLRGEWGADYYHCPVVVQDLADNLQQGIDNLHSQGKTVLHSVLKFNTDTNQWEATTNKV